MPADPARPQPDTVAHWLAARLDPGWLFLLAGLVMAIAWILVPAQRELDRHRWEATQLAAEEQQLIDRLRRHDDLIAAIDERDPDVLVRLADSQLGLVPADQRPVFTATNAIASTSYRIDRAMAPLPRSSFDPSDTLLTRLVSGPSRLWVLGAAALSIFVGLLLGPSRPRRTTPRAASRRIRRPTATPSRSPRRVKRRTRPAQPPVVTAVTVAATAADDEPSAEAVTATTLDDPTLETESRLADEFDDLPEVVDEIVPPPDIAIEEDCPPSDELAADAEPEEDCPPSDELDADAESEEDCPPSDELDADAESEEDCPATPSRPAAARSYSPVTPSIAAPPPDRIRARSIGATEFESSADLLLALDALEDGAFNAVTDAVELDRTADLTDDPIDAPDARAAVTTTGDDDAPSDALSAVAEEDCPPSDMRTADADPEEDCPPSDVIMSDAESEEDCPPSDVLISDAESEEDCPPVKVRPADDEAEADCPPNQGLTAVADAAGDTSIPDAMGDGTEILADDTAAIVTEADDEDGEIPADTIDADDEHDADEFEDDDEDIDDEADDDEEDVIYVDEDGNEIPADELEDEDDEEVIYVDEDGNEIPADELEDDDEYDDEEDDDEEDVIYVDEDGNEIPADELEDYDTDEDDDEVIYVDEDGNEIPADEVERES